MLHLVPCTNHVQGNVQGNVIFFVQGSAFLCILPLFLSCFWALNNNKTLIKAIYCAYNQRFKDCGPTSTALLQLNG